MKLFGLDLPRFSHRDALRDVSAALAVVVGFGIGGWLLGTPLDRQGAIALFVGCLYAFLIDPFIAARDARGKRWALAAIGAGTLVATAFMLEQAALL
jgi:hypothetical protein